MNLEKCDFAIDNLYLIPVEFFHNEAIEPLIVGAAIVSQEPESLLLANEKAADAVGTVMNAGGIAAKSNVAGQFLDLVTQSEVSTVPPLLAVHQVMDRFCRYLVPLR